MQRNSSLNRMERGFTLIEMMVVIVIILILSGMLLKIMGLVGHKTAVSRCEYELQQIQNALNEFYSEYGHYPPMEPDANCTNAVEYECEASYKNTQSSWFRNTFLPAHNNPDDPDNFFADKKRSPGTYFYGKKGNLGYRYGLYSYLFKRAYPDDGSAQPHAYDKDTDRDIAAKERWHHFIDDLHIWSWWRGHKSPPDIGSQAPYSNRVVTIIDPWDNNYRYECRPPYLGYKLWSAGPDGKDGTEDDIHASNDKK